MGKQVHVLISTYNRPASLKRAYESVLDQSIVADLDIVICDDHSDKIPDIDYVTLIRGPHMGPADKAAFCCTMARVLNQGIRACGDPEGYYAYLTDDGYWSPKHLERLRDILDREPECVAAFSLDRVIHNGKTMMENLSAIYPDRIEVDWIRERLAATYMVGKHCTLMHRGMLEWSEDPGCWNGPDMAAWKNLATRPGYWRCNNIPDVVLYNDNHDMGESARSGLTVEEALRHKATHLE